MWRWKNREMRQVTGTSFSKNMNELAEAINQNADVLKEAVQKIEGLHQEIERLKGKERVSDKGSAGDKGTRSNYYSHDSISAIERRGKYYHRPDLWF